jgi:hypothetical protein
MEGADVMAGKPPVGAQYEAFKFVGTRANATWYMATNAAFTQFYYYGLLLQGANLYRHTTYVYDDDRAPVATFKKVGTGWSSFKSIATSNYSVGAPRHAYCSSPATTTNWSASKHQHQKKARPPGRAFPVVPTCRPDGAGKR